jgi:parallel beta-helix repeat protein
MFTRRPQVELLETRDLPSAGGFLSNAVFVQPGQSIQAAVDAATVGESIFIEPGVYQQTVVVNKPDIHLIGLPGRGGVVIANPGDAGDGILVTSNGTGFDLENLTVRGFDENGVSLQGVSGFQLARVTAVNDGEYGLFPVLSAHGVIVDCAASGHRDTGIYVGQSFDVAIVGCRTFDNVNGIEVENSSAVRVLNNDTFHNTAGILIDLLPGLQITTASHNLVSGNRVRDNNHANFGDPGQIESFVPSGTGILVLGTDHTTVTGNVITGNQFVGIAVASTTLLGQLAGLPPDAFAGIDPNPQSVLIKQNVVVHNGLAPPPAGLPVSADLLWDGSGNDNHWVDNVFQTSFPAPLP